MSAVAYVFPGQGSQRVGMGRSLAEAFPEARAVFEEADDTLGFSLSGLCFEGPEDELQLTANTQPAIVAMSVAVLRCYLARDPLPEAPAFVAGHDRARCFGPPLSTRSVEEPSGRWSFERYRARR